MSRCGWCIDGLHEDCRDGEFKWRCLCDHPVRSGAWTATNGRICWACPRCRWGRGYATAEERDLAAARHACPWRGADMPAGKSIIQTAWEQLDDQVLEIIELTPLVEECRRTNRPDLAGNIDKLIAAKARARGKAEILALLTVPHFTTADQVSEESGRRLVAIQRGDASYRTPGLEDAQVSR